MRCFVHRDKDAVGICRACGKGLCEDCAADLGHGLACKASCVERVELLNALNRRSATIYSSQKRYKYVMPLFFVAFGLILFLYCGVYYGQIISINSLTGLLMLAFGAFLYYVVVRSTRDSANVVDKDAI